jgi:hypothetical protein
MFAQAKSLYEKTVLLNAHLGEMCRHMAAAQSLQMSLHRECDNHKKRQQIIDSQDECIARLKRDLKLQLAENDRLHSYMAPGGGGGTGKGYTSEGGSSGEGRAGRPSTRSPEAQSMLVHHTIAQTCTHL